MVHKFYYMNKLITLDPAVKEVLELKAKENHWSLKKYIEIMLTEIAEGKLIALNKPK